MALFWVISLAHPNQTWYVENGHLVSGLIRRMPYEQVFLWLNNLNEYERRDTLDRLHFNEMIHGYDNVLDRLAASVKLTKKLKKMPFPVTVGPITRPFGWYVRPFGDAVAFHAFFDSHDQDESISMLNICEDDAIDILRFTTDILPYSADRYYEETHYPFQTMQAMVERLKIIKEILLHDPYSNLLTQYLPKDGNYPTRVDDIADRRFDIIKMFDLFNEWADKQITMYNYNSGMFVISGP